MNVEGCAGIVSPPGPRNATETLRSGLPAGFVPVGSRTETMIRFGPTPSSVETIVGRTSSRPDPIGDPVTGVVGLALVLDAQAVTTSRTAVSAAGRNGKFTGVA